MTQYATPPRFGTQPIEEYDSGLSQITLADALADPAALFDAPPPVRTPTRARVICLVCGNEARIPILRDGKVCDTCLANLPGEQARIEAALDDATQRSFNADLDLHTLLADAHEQTAARYQNAVALREVGDPRIAAAWAKALAAGDGLSVLLAAHDTHIAAAQALNQLLIQSQVALAEIEKVR